MAGKAELAESLLKRFKDVPNVTLEDAMDWVDRAFLEHGYVAEADLNPKEALLVLLFAEWDGAMQISLKTAHFYEYQDSEETIDKRTVSEQYRRLASELWKRYVNKKAEGVGDIGGVRFTTMTRADRP